MQSLAQDDVDQRRRLTVRKSAPDLLALSRALGDEFGLDATRRVREGIDCLLSGERPPDADPRQRPALFFMPGIPTGPFPDIAPESELGRFIAGLEAGYDAIRAELDTRRAEDYTDYLGDGYMRTKFAGLADDEWQSVAIYGGEKWHHPVPTLRSLVDSFAGIISGEIIVSRLRSGAVIPPHVDDNNYQLTVQLGLNVPAGDCAIRVGSETRHWQEGRCIAFYDSFVHDAWNRTGSNREVLLIDSWSPQVTRVERAALGRLRRLLYRRADRGGDR